MYTLFGMIVSMIISYSRYVCFLALFFMFLPVAAQVTTPANNFIENTETSIEISPTSPKPGDIVTATLNDYGAGLFGASVVWRVDGQIVADATNRREAQVIVGNVGEETIVEVILSSPQGSERVIRQVIVPLYLDIVLEPQTHIPDFYQGRAHPSMGSLVNATALIYDGSYRERDYVYTWRLNRQVIEFGPLRGRNQVSFEMPRGRESTLALEIHRVNGEMVAKRAIIVPSVYPELYFYEVSSLYGVRPYAIKTTMSLLTNSTSLIAVPYNLDRRVYNAPAETAWSIGGAPYSSFANPYQVSIQRTDSAGRSNVSFLVRDTTEVLQTAKGSIRVEY